MAKNTHTNPFQEKKIEISQKKKISPQLELGFGHIFLRYSVSKKQSKSVKCKANARRARTKVKSGKFTYRNNSKGLLMKKKCL